MQKQSLSLRTFPCTSSAAQADQLPDLRAPGSNRAACGRGPLCECSIVIKVLHQDWLQCLSQTSTKEKKGRLQRSQAASLPASRHRHHWLLGYPSLPDPHLWTHSYQEEPRNSLGTGRLLHRKGYHRPGGGGICCAQARGGFAQHRVEQVLQQVHCVAILNICGSMCMISKTRRLRSYVVMTAKNILNSNNIFILSILVAQLF